MPLHSLTSNLAILYAIGGWDITAARGASVPVRETNGLRVSCSDTGGGAPVVFLPGLAGTADWFRYQSSGLSDRFNVITCDLKRAHRDHDAEHLADELGQALLSLKVYDAAVVGYSLGGLIALRYALANPDRCPAVVLCSAAPSYESVSEAEMLQCLLPGFIKPQGLWQRMVNWFTSVRGAPNPHDEPGTPPAVPVPQLDVATLEVRLRMMRRTNLTELLPDVEVPALVVTSSGDPSFVHSGSQILYESIPDSSLEVIDTPDRFYFYTRHDLFNQLIADYLVDKIARF